MCTVHRRGSNGGPRRASWQPSWHISTMKVIDANGVRYAIGDGMVLQVLADGTPGPAVGRIDRDGAIIIDEELAARGGECWVGELLTATLPREPHSGRPAYTLPAEMVAAIRRFEVDTKDDFTQDWLIFAG